MKEKVLIIAEAGVNHNGDFEIAKKLVDAAADAGADYVKFQTFKANKLVSETAKQADYQIANLGSGESTQYQMLKKLEMPDEWHFELKSYASKKGIGFLSTGFDEGSIDFLNELGMDLFKIPSGEVTNMPYLKHVASKGKPIVLSTGMANLSEISAAINVLTDNGINRNNITVLHCNTEYPTPLHDVNLLAMLDIKEKINTKIGFSDHTLGIEVPVGAVALGAKLIEKHFTLDRLMPGPDHRASLEPDELKAMISAIRNIEVAIAGSGIKEPSNSELKNIVAARRSIHLNKSLPKGHILSEDDLIMKRPGDGISPMNMMSVIGRKLRNDLPPEHKLDSTDIE
jgi:N,N'-diacetyllegionaminate synthase